MVLPVTQRAGWQKEAVRGIRDRGEWGLDGGCPERARGDKLWTVKELVAASRQELIRAQAGGVEEGQDRRHFGIEWSKLGVLPRM